MIGVAPMLASVTDIRCSIRQECSPTVGARVGAVPSMLFYALGSRRCRSRLLYRRSRGRALGFANGIGTSVVIGADLAR